MVKGRLNLVRVVNRQADRHKLAEDRMIREKKDQIAALDSAVYHRRSKEKQANMRAVAHSLPLEAFGAKCLIKIKDVRTGSVFTVDERAKNDFFDTHPRPHDLVIL